MNADDDGLSTRTPTRSELDTFKVLVNTDFVDFSRAPLTTRAQSGLDDIQETRSERSATSARSSGIPEALRAAVERYKSESRGPSYERRAEQAFGHHEANDDAASSVSRHGPTVGYDRPETYSVPRSADGRESEASSDTDAILRRNHADLVKDGYRASSGPTTEPSAGPTGPSRSASAPRAPSPDPHADLRRKLRMEAQVDVELEKEGLLMELQAMEKQGLITLHRKLTMSDSLDAIQYQYDKANMIISAQQTVDWAKTAIKFGSVMVEGLLKNFGITVMDGFNKNLCSDMTKFDRPLTKLYRKYWRRGTSSAEMELTMVFVSALAMTVAQNNAFLSFLSGSNKKQASTKEPFARPAVPGANTAGPLMTQQPMQASGGPSGPPAGPAAPKPAAKMPDWAIAAMKAPEPSMMTMPSISAALLDAQRPSAGPVQPVTREPEPELRLKEPSLMPVTTAPVPVVPAVPAVPSVPAVPAVPSVPAVPTPVPEAAPGVKTIPLGALGNTGLGSPTRSMRRKKTEAVELNFDA
jgi:hypothetical protein